MTKRTIIFHVGQPKTGSSALQAFLSQNQKALEKQGICYPFPEGQKSITSGNCSGNLMHRMQDIAKNLENSADKTPLTPKDLFERHLSEAIQTGLATSKEPITLFSSEAFMTPLAQFALPVLKALSREVKVKLICFVRDPYDFTVSAWKQVAKTGSTTKDFERFTSSRVAAGFVGLDRAVAYIKADLRIDFINYDVHRKDIYGAFLRTIGLEDQSNDFAVPPKVNSNPSFSYSQAAVLVQARNTVQSSLFAALLTKRFRNQKVIEKDPYHRDIDVKILDFLKDDLERLNDFLPEGEKLRTTVREKTILAPPHVSMGILKTVMEVIDETMELEARRPNFKKVNGLPADFDPMAYLLINPDIEEAGADPVRHYLDNGRFEGRQYK